MSIVSDSLTLLSLAGMLLLSGCQEKNSRNSSSEQEQTTIPPTNPDIQTDYGKLPGGGRTMDEYYIDDQGNKVYHGYRKNFYPSGQPKMVSKYEHGELLWTKEFDQAGVLEKSY